MVWVDMAWMEGETRGGVLQSEGLYGCEEKMASGQGGNNTQRMFILPPHKKQ